ncbi:MAG: D-amino acid aminotransferase [Peptococcaceae bacterium]|nr:D-amino acid aminotransferase [Peptococcaceae bacterium]
MPDLAWVNGEVSNLLETKVSFLDHGYFFGYGVYEAFKVYAGKPFAMEDHLDRLERSMKEIRITPDFTRDELTKNIYDLVRRSELQDAMVYLQVTRGVGPRSHSPLKNPKPTLGMFVSYLPPIPEEIREKGIKAVILKDDRWAHPFIKTLNLLPNVLAKQIAEENGAYEAILVRDNGSISEASSSNVFAVFGDTIVTPPLDGKILSGITRLVVLRILEKSNLKFKEDYFTDEQLRNADEVFITNTGAEVLAVTSLDGKPVGKGIPGPKTKQLYQLFMQEVPSYL